MVELLKRYMNWYENREALKKERAKVSDNDLTNTRQYIKNDMKDKLSLFNWVFSYQNIFTYIAKVLVFMFVFILLFNLVIMTSELQETQQVLGSIFFSLFIPYLSFALIAFAKGLKKGLLFMFPTCIISLPIYLIVKAFGKK